MPSRPLFDYFQAIRNNDKATVKAVLFTGEYPVNFQNAFGLSALHIATIYGKYEMVELIGAFEPDLQLVNSSGCSALHIAAMHAHHEGYVDIFKSLLRLGADTTFVTQKPVAVPAWGSEPVQPAYEPKTAVQMAQASVQPTLQSLVQSTAKDPAYLAQLKAVYHENPFLPRTLAVASETISTTTTSTSSTSATSQAASAAAASGSSGGGSSSSSSNGGGESPIPVPRGTSVLLFPGQGTQFVGMCSDILVGEKTKSERALALFQKASAVLGYNLQDVCLKGPESKLTSTEVSQPAVFVASLAALEDWKVTHPTQFGSVGHVAGFSLGEYTALVAAGALSVEDGLRVVKARASAMQAASLANVGTMASIVGLDDSTLAQIVAEVHTELGGKSKSKEGVVLQVANLLFPKGRVVSGDVPAVELAMKKADARKALKTQRLVVGGAFHTAHMAAAKDAIREVLQSVTLTLPKDILIYSNVTGAPYRSLSELRARLEEQVVAPVQWERTMEALIATGGPLAEVGPGEQLKAMVKRVQMPAWQRTESVGHWLPPKK